MDFNLNKAHGMTHQNTSGVGCARTAQKHVSPQNGASSKLEASGVGCARTAQKHVSPQNGASSKPEATAFSQPPPAGQGWYMYRGKADVQLI
jgi:hypothetical protein